MADSLIGGGRALKVCDVCGGCDDHPRHEFAGAIPGVQVAEPPSQAAVDRVNEVAPTEHRARLLRDLFDTTTGQRHLDCCREAGCPTGTCGVRTRGAEDKRGKALLAHLSRSGDLFPDRDDVAEGK